MNIETLRKGLLLTIFTVVATLGTWATTTKSADAQSYGTPYGQQQYGYMQTVQDNDNDDDDNDTDSPGTYSMGMRSASPYGSSNTYPAARYGSNAIVVLNEEYTGGRLMWTGGAWVVVSPCSYGIAPWYGGYGMGGYSGYGGYGPRGGCGGYGGYRY